MTRTGNQIRLPRFFVLLSLLMFSAAFAETNHLLERPTPEEGNRIKIFFTIGVLDIDDVSNAKQSFTVNIFTLFRWHDPRLRHEGPENARMKISEIWHPNLMFLNRQRIWASLDQIAEVTPDGMVSLRRQFWGDFSQPMDLRDFPFDQQTFRIQIVSSDSGTAENLKFIANTNPRSFLPKTYSVPDWQVVDFSAESKALEVPNVGEIPMFEMNFTANRISNHYLIKMMAPLLMIVLLSQVVFWLNPSDGGSQLGVAVTSFLTVIAYHVALNSSLPQISYLTRLDVYVFWGTSLVFLSMIEVVITTGLAQKGKESLARKVDRKCRIIFPSLTMLGGLYAIFWY